MGLFDTVSHKDSVSFGNSVTRNQTAHPKRNHEYIETEASKIKAERLARRQNSELIYAENRKLQNSMPVMPGSKKVGMEQVNTVSEHPMTTREELVRHVNKTRNVFMESLSHSLFIGKISVINVEACLISEKNKSDDRVKKIIYEHGLSIFNSICKEEDFSKIAVENGVPSFVVELWDLACESAEVEAKRRFDYAKIKESVGLDEEKINEYLQNEANDLVIRNESLANYFEATASQILFENDDVIDSIKSKISEEIDDYKKSAQKIADVKKAVKGDIDEADKIPGSNGQSDEKPEEGSDASDKTVTDGETDADSNPEDGQESKDDNKSDSDSAPDDNSNSEDEPNPENSETDAEKTEPDESSSGENENPTNEEDDPLENQQKLQELSPEITQELEDAASFAMNYSHTFNTGDEKFEKMRKRLSTELVAAMDKNDLNKMNEIKTTVVAMKNKLHSVNASSDDKYKDMEKKLDDMINSTSFEINRRIEKTTVETENDRSLLESLILKIAKRKVSSAPTNEGFEFDEISATATIEEAIIYRTTMETFNTLKMYPKTPLGIKSIKETINGIKH